MLAVLILSGILSAALAQANGDADREGVRATDPRTVAASPKARQFSAAQMLRLGAAAEATGDVRTAALIYDALRNDRDRPIRSEARFRLAKQLIAAKRLSAAALLLRSILDEGSNALPVRLRLAEVLHLLGDETAALAQLRAARASHLPAAVARLIDRYSEAIRAQRSSGATFEIALAPDSNINRATTSDALGTILGDFAIDRSSKARSGTGLSFLASVFRRFPIGNGTSKFLVRGTASADLYRAKKFNNIAVDVSGGPEFQRGSIRLNAEIGLTQRWFGQRRLLTAEHAALSLLRPVGRRSQLFLSTTATHTQNRLNPLQNGNAYSIQSSLDHALSPRTGLVVSGGVERQTAGDPAYASKGWNGGITMWRDVGRITVAASGSLRHLDADARLLLFPRRRADRFSSITLATTLRQLQVHGFAPIFRFSLERNRSSVGIYDYRRKHVEIGLVRAF